MQTNYTAIAACLGEKGFEHFKEVSEMLASRASQGGPAKETPRQKQMRACRAMAAAINGE